MRPRIPAITLSRLLLRCDPSVFQACPGPLKLSARAFVVRSGSLTTMLPRAIGVMAVCAALCAADAAAQVRVGQTVRVRLATGEPFVERVVGIDSAARALRFADARLLLVSEIDTLWVRRRATGRGALIGGIVVGGASFGLLVLVCRAIGEGEECNAWGTVIGLTAVGAGGGALLGAGIGSLIPRWQRVDPQRITVSLDADTRRLSIAARIHF